MERTKRFLLGRSRERNSIHPESAIDPRLLSLDERKLRMKPPSTAPSAIAHAEVSASKYPTFLAEEIDVLGNIAPGPDSNISSPFEVSSTFCVASLNPVDQSTLSTTTANVDSLAYNDFDAAFVDYDVSQDNRIVDVNAISYLSLWIAKNNSNEPSMKQLKALETLTEVPVFRLSEWLRCDGKALVANYTPAPRLAEASHAIEEPYRVRCVESGFRYRPRNTELNGSDSRKAFGCTNQCGQTFQRKGDWSRHEKMNFEEWPCPDCEKILSRCEHLEKHFKDAHPDMTRVSKFQKRQFLKAEQRPCGFCGDTLTHWNAWLAHVGGHFEGGPGGKRRDVLQWRANRQPPQVADSLV